MEEDYVSYELAKKLKKLGFDELTNFFYNEVPGHEGELELGGGYANFNSFRMPGCGCTSAPTLWFAWKWLRYEKNIDVDVNYNTKDYEIVSYEWSIFTLSPCDLIDNADDSYQSYEEALEAGIMRAVEMLLSGELDEEDDDK